MRVLTVADYVAPNSGNFIGSLYDFTLYMRKFDDDVIFIFPDTENTRRCGNWVTWLRDLGCSVYLINKNMRPIEQLDFLKKIIEKERIDILHIHFGLFHSIVTRNRNELTCKVIVHDHMGYPVGCNYIKQSIRYLLRSGFYRMNKIGVINVNKQVDQVNIFANHWYVPNGLSIKRNVSCTICEDDVRNNNGIKNDEKEILFLGWDIYRKGLDVSIKAVQTLREKGINAILAIIGVDIGENDTSKAYKFIIEHTGINPRSPWIKYISGGEDMFAIHRTANVYLSSSRSEAFPYGLLEAISENRPVVVSDIKSTNWCWKYSKSFVYPVEDALACADAISKALLVSNDSSNYKDIIKEYSIDKWCEKIRSIYLEILDK